MAKKRLMPISDILRMGEAGEKATDIANTLSIHETSVYRYYNLRDKKGLSWSLLKDLTDYELDELFNKREGPKVNRVEPDFSELKKVFKDRVPKERRKRFCIRELYELYQSIHGKHSYGRSHFFTKYQEYTSSKPPSMLLDHDPGEMQIDFCGLKLRYRDESGSIKKAEIFCTCLALSKFIFLRACASQKIEDWIECHIAAINYYGGVPSIWLIDNLKAGVDKPGSKPVINRSYLECARYYGAYVKTARVRRAQDKALVENAVGFATNRILTPLSDRIFPSLAELNQVILGKLEELNSQNFQNEDGNRRGRFTQLEFGHLKPKPSQPFQYGRWMSPRKVPNTCHIKIESHSYSIPHDYMGKVVEPRLGARFIEFFHKGKCVAMHARSYQKDGFTRDVHHLTKAQQEYLKQSYEDYIAWAERFGIAAKSVIDAQFNNTDHQCPKALARCKRLKDIARHQDGEHFESACLYALELGSPTPTRIQDILVSKAYSLPNVSLVEQIRLPLHENVRGGDYYSGRNI